MKPPPLYENVDIHRPRKNNTVWIILGVLGIGSCCFCVPVLGAILFPVFAQARLAAKRSGCLKNLKEIAIANTIYAGDYDNVELSANSWTDQLAVYAGTKSNALFTCPGVTGSYGYAMNERVSSVKLATIKDLKNAVFTFDSTVQERNAHLPTVELASPPHHGRNNESFLDGHASRVVPIVSF